MRSLRASGMTSHQNVLKDGPRMWLGPPAGTVTWTNSVWFNPASVVLTEADVYTGNT